MRPAETPPIRSKSYAPTYYPIALGPAEAQPVPVGPGREVAAERAIADGQLGCARIASAPPWTPQAGRPPTHL